MKIVSDINAFVYIVLTIFYCYQGIYVIIALLGKKEKRITTPKLRHFTNTHLLLPHVMKMPLSAI